MSNGTWSNGPTSFAYEWLRLARWRQLCEHWWCDGCGYVVQAADVGLDVEGAGDGEQRGGPGAAVTSGQTSVVTAAPVSPPVNSVLPVVWVRRSRGRRCRCRTAPVQRSDVVCYQWLRCSSAGASCVSIGGATAASYVVQAADVGSTLRARVTASNAGGPGAAVTSGQTSVVTAAPAGLAVAIVAPLSGQTLSGKVTWEATVTGGVVYSVAFAIGAGTKKMDDTAPYVFDVTATTRHVDPENGTHTLTVTVTDLVTDGDRLDPGHDRKRRRTGFRVRAGNRGQRGLRPGRPRSREYPFRGPPSRGMPAR